MSSANIVNEGDLVLLVFDERRKWLVKVEKDKKLHTHKGVIDLNNVIGKPYGSSVESSTGAKFRIFKPLLKDYILKMRRTTQIIYPKDIGLILLYSGIGPGWRVVEAGTGSGALTIVLAYYVRPDGHVYTYEAREEFQRLAMKNIRRVGLEKYVTFKLKDVNEGIDERNVDAIILDMATPWLVVPHAYEALKDGGSFVSYSPTIEQVQKTVYALSRTGFYDIITMECLTRRILVREGKTRPETSMIAHTGYITFARKIILNKGLKVN